MWTSLALVLVFAFLTTTWSAPVWRLPGLAQASRTLTYPWQLLGLTGPFLALLGGSLAMFASHVLDEMEGTAMWAALLAMVLLSSYGYLQPLTTTFEPAATPIAVMGDNQILVLDAQIEGDLHSGRGAVAHVRWQALKPLDIDYTVFVHVIDEMGERVAQVDRLPQVWDEDDIAELYATTQWRVGEVIEDHYALRFAGDAGQDYEVHLGLYDLETGNRMEAGEDDRVVIGGGS